MYLFKFITLLILISGVTCTEYYVHRSRSFKMFKPVTDLKNPHETATESTSTTSSTTDTTTTKITGTIIITTPQRPSTVTDTAATSAGPLPTSDIDIASRFNRTKIEFCCSCGYFESKYPTTFDNPILDHTVINFLCRPDASLSETCQNYCVHFNSNKTKSMEQHLCKRLHDATNEIILLYTRICNGQEQWIYSGVTTLRPICCQSSHVVDCSYIKFID